MNKQKKDKHDQKKKIIVFDTTLRDGEQSAGNRLDASEKITIARQLARLNVDVIEAGYPNSSGEDFHAVEAISSEIKDVVITALSRAVPDDVFACIKALKNTVKPRIHTGLGVSRFHIMGKFHDDKYGRTYNKKKEYLASLAVDAVKLARSGVDDVQFYAEDAGRADKAYLYSMLEQVIEAGAATVNIPDTTGYANPEQFGRLIADIRANVANIGKAVISVHCHNDLGMATANTLAGIMNGAAQVECTINGIGERAGNASLEEIVMNLNTRKDFYNASTGININEIYRTCVMVSAVFGMPIPPNKAVVGSKVFSHSSGIHVDGFLKSRDTYEIMKPEDIGFPSSRIILTARSGRAALGNRFAELGYAFSGEELNSAYGRFIEIGDKMREVTDDIIISIAEKTLGNGSRAYQ